MDENKEKEQKDEDRKSYSNIEFMAVYGSMETPKNHYQIASVADDCQLSNWSTNEIQVDCDNLAAVSDAYIKKPVLRKRIALPRKLKYKAKLGPKYVRRNINMKKKGTLANRDWGQISVHPFINFLRVYRRKFARNTPNEEIARRGRYEWRKMTCQLKAKYYDQAQRARIRGYKI